MTAPWLPEDAERIVELAGQRNVEIAIRTFDCAGGIRKQSTLKCQGIRGSDRETAAVVELRRYGQAKIAAVGDDVAAGVEERTYLDGGGLAGGKQALRVVELAAEDDVKIAVRGLHGAAGIGERRAVQGQRIGGGDDAAAVVDGAGGNQRQVAVLGNQGSVAVVDAAGGDIQAATGGDAVTSAPAAASLTCRLAPALVSDKSPLLEIVRSPLEAASWAALRTPMPAAVATIRTVPAFGVAPKAVAASIAQSWPMPALSLPAPAARTSEAFRIDGPRRPDSARRSPSRGRSAIVWAIRSRRASGAERPALDQDSAAADLEHDAGGIEARCGAVGVAEADAASSANSPSGVLRKVQP